MTCRLKTLLVKPTDVEFRGFIKSEGYQNVGHPFWGASLFRLEFDYEVIAFKKGDPFKLLVSRSWGKWKIKDVENVPSYSVDELNMLVNGNMPSLKLKSDYDRNVVGSQRFRRSLVRVR